MREVKDWMGRLVRLAESKGGVLAFADPLAGLIQGGVQPWPAPAIVQKLYRSRQERAFSDQDHAAVTEALGFYSDLQSVHSEDAITWNVFGPVAHADTSDRARFVSELLEAANLSSDDGPATISLWRRIPHPETLVPGGPEVDAILQTPSTVVFVEAKWQSSLGTGQGKRGDRDQVELRIEFFAKYGKAVFPGVTSMVVLGASWQDSVISDQHAADPQLGIQVRDLSWATLCDLPGHPVGNELSAYLAWKERHTRI